MTIEVTKEDFYKAIGGPENIHPRSEEYRSVWVNQDTRAVVGTTTPGYKGSFGVASRYYLTSEFAARKGVTGVKLP